MDTRNLTELPPVNEVIPRSKADDNLFRELAEVLKKHNALNRFGITLLHKHFDMGKDEFLLEETDISKRLQLIRPVRESEVQDEEFLETAWRIGENGSVAMTVSVR